MRFYVIALSIYAVVLTILATLLVIQNRQLKARNQGIEPVLDVSTVHEVDLQDIPILGNPNAPVTVVVFSDFECHACAIGSQNIRKILDRFPDHIRVGFKFLTAPNHPNSPDAASVALAAFRQDRFWEMERRLFENQHRLSKELYHELAEELGLDLPTFIKMMDQKNWEEYLLLQQNEAEVLKITGTPTFFVNGIKVSGTSYGKLESAVQYFMENGQ